MTVRRVVLSPLAMLVATVSLIAPPRVVAADAAGSLFVRPHAVFNDHIVWGRFYPGRHELTYRPRPGKPPSMQIYSVNRQYVFSVQSNGDISTSKFFIDGDEVCSHSRHLPAGYGCYLPYWREGNGSRIVLQRDGNIVIYGSDGDVVYASGQHPGAGHNYALTMGDAGDLVETYSVSTPLGPGSSVLWRTGRAPGKVRPCAGGAIGSGVTSWIVPAVNGAEMSTVKITNDNYLGVVVEVYRYLSGPGADFNVQTRYVGPYSHKIIKANWYVGDNGPQGMDMRTRTDATNLAAAASFIGHCWYRLDH